jgi:hypothetical protein
VGVAALRVHVGSAMLDWFHELTMDHRALAGEQNCA